MSRGVRFVGPLLLLVGGALLGISIATGGAHLYLLLVVPVFTGTSALFGVAVALLVGGFLLLPVVFTSEARQESTPGPANTGFGPPDVSEEGSGGLLLIGPVPIFFGTWRKQPPISYRWAVVLGVVLAVVAVLVLWGFSLL